MADAVTTNLYTGDRNLVLTVLDLSDGTGLTNYAALTATSFTPNLGVHMKAKRIWYSIINMQVQIIWGGVTPSPMAILGPGENEIDWSKTYSGGLPNNATTPNGNVLITAIPMASATAGFTLTLEMIRGTQQLGT